MVLPRLPYLKSFRTAIVEIKLISAYNNAMSIKSGRFVKKPNNAINKTVAVPKVFMAKIRSNTVGPSTARSKRKNITTKIAIVVVINIVI